MTNRAIGGLLPFGIAIGMGVGWLSVTFGVPGAINTLVMVGLLIVGTWLEALYGGETA